MIYRLTTTVNWCRQSHYNAGDASSIKIVRANSEDEARELAAASAGNETAEAWLHDSTTVEVVTRGKEAVLASE